MATGPAFSSIASTTLTSTATSYTFSSIPATYTDLVLVVSGSLTASTGGPIVRFNGDSASNYSDTSLYGTGGAATSGGDVNSPNIYAFGVEAMSTGISQLIVHIFNYANTTTYKTVLTRFGDLGSGGTSSIAGAWRSTSAINSVYVSNHTGQSFSIGSTFSLYGIAAA